MDKPSRAKAIRFTPEEDAIIRKMWPNSSIADIAEAIGRPTDAKGRKAVSGRARSIGLPSRVHRSVHTVAVSLQPSTPSVQLDPRLPGVTSAVVARIIRLRDVEIRQWKIIGEGVGLSVDVCRKLYYAHKARFEKRSVTDTFADVPSTTNDYKISRVGRISRPAWFDEDMQKLMMGRR